MWFIIETNTELGERDTVVSIISTIQSQFNKQSNSVVSNYKETTVRTSEDEKQQKQRNELNKEIEQLKQDIDKQNRVNHSKEERIKELTHEILKMKKEHISKQINYDNRLRRKIKELKRIKSN